MHTNILGLLFLGFLLFFNVDCFPQGQNHVQNTQSGQMGNLRRPRQDDDNSDEESESDVEVSTRGINDILSGVSQIVAGSLSGNLGQILGGAFNTVTDTEVKTNVLDKLHGGLFPTLPPVSTSSTETPPPAEVQPEIAEVVVEQTEIPIVPAEAETEKPKEKIPLYQQSIEETYSQIQLGPKPEKITEVQKTPEEKPQENIREPEIVEEFEVITIQKSPESSKIPQIEQVDIKLVPESEVQKDQSIEIIKTSEKVPEIIEIVQVQIVPEIIHETEVQTVQKTQESSDKVDEIQKTENFESKITEESEKVVENEKPEISQNFEKVVENEKPEISQNSENVVKTPEIEKIEENVKHVEPSLGEIEKAELTKKFEEKIKEQENLIRQQNIILEWQRMQQKMHEKQQEEKEQQKVEEFKFTAAQIPVKTAALEGDKISEIILEPVEITLVEEPTAVAEEFLISPGEEKVVDGFKKVDGALGSGDPDNLIGLPEPQVDIVKTTKKPIKSEEDSEESKESEEITEVPEKEEEKVVKKTTTEAPEENPEPEVITEAEIVEVEIEETERPESEVTEKVTEAPQVETEVENSEEKTNEDKKVQELQLNQIEIGDEVVKDEIEELIKSEELKLIAEQKKAEDLKKKIEKEELAKKKQKLEEEAEGEDEEEGSEDDI